LAITLQPAGDCDEAFLRALYASTRQDETAAWGWTPAQVDAFLALQFLAQRTNYATAYPGAKHELILEDGHPIGRLYVWRKGDELRLVDISVLPAARGRGIGTSLIRRLMAEATPRRERLCLQVATTNRARQLYLRLGFRRTGGDAVYDEMEWCATPAAEQ
jgi:ribosomal protein S18 acetylase RimI-like enzyme